MSAYSGTPTVISSWEVGDRNGKLQRVFKRLTLTLASQGGLTNVVAATSLGFTAGNLLSARCIMFTDGSANKRYVGLFTDGTNLYVADPSVATDADRGEAADVTGDLVCEVEGYN